MLQVKKEKDRKAVSSQSKTSDADSQQSSSSVSDTSSVQFGVKGSSGQQSAPHSQISTTGSVQSQPQQSSQQQQQQQPHPTPSATQQPAQVVRAVSYETVVSQSACIL